MDATARRKIALERAQTHSPFLRETIRAFPDIAETFATKGAPAAIALSLGIEADNLAAELRRRRSALALAVALGDLSGELDLEGVTSALSDFADEAIDRALREAMAERVSGAGTNGFAVLALGKLGSRELNYSSDVDLILLFDPAVLPRRSGTSRAKRRSASRRRLVELLQQRTEDGYVAGSTCAFGHRRKSPRSRCRSTRPSPIMNRRRCRGSARRSSAPARAGDKCLGTLPARSSRSSGGGARFRAIDEIRDISIRIRDHYAQGQAFGPGYD
jgi:glutamate-ammonia-ligase adenylyltransferase